MDNVVNFLAKKYLKFKTKDKNISFMTRICFLGIFIGTFSLMVTFIITSGFEKTIHEKMQGINAQLIIQSPGNQLDYQEIRDVLENEFSFCIKGISARKTRQMILNYNNSQQVVFLTGVDEQNEQTVTNISNKIIKTDNSQKYKNITLKKLLQKNDIILGHKIAQQHGFNVGDKVTLMLPEATGKKKISLRNEDVHISGIFKVGLEEYDNNIAFSSLGFVQELFDEEGVDCILLSFYENEKVGGSFLSSFFYSYFEKIKRLFFNKTYEEEIIEKLKKRFVNMNIYSWKDLYPALVSSLQLEKYVMFFIIVLISLVAAMNMISLLFMQIQQKRRDIAIYKVMGMPHKQIKRIFLKIGLRITFFASICGLVFAFIVGYVIKRYPFIQLPDVYYISYLPAHISFDLFIIVFCAIMLIGFVASWIPAQNVDRVNIVEVLRQE